MASSTSTPESQPGGRIAVGITTLAGLGRLPAPGTWGSLAGIAVAAVLLAVCPPAAVPAACAWGALIASVTGIAACPAACRRLRRKDPPQVIIDEVAGQLLAVAMVPAAALAAAPIAILVAAFLLFRLFDIAKPFPVGALEALPGGVGVVADDLAAGVVAGMLVAAAWH